MNFDIIVVGAGHAGCEAAHISAQAGLKTALVTPNLQNIADMPCNPSIGGSAKGIVVREIAALGGIMPKIADQSILQMKLLNTKKGPGVRSLRAQIDKVIYQTKMIEVLSNLKTLTIIEDLVIDLQVKNETIVGVVLESGKAISANSVILTTGTYLNSRILVGSEITKEGPHGERTDERLSVSLIDNGIALQRLKTGTPPRIDKTSVNYQLVKEEYGDEQNHTFSFNTQAKYLVKEQLPCYLTYTTQKTKQIIEENLSLSSMYGGINEKLGIGPRYCPSIEDKITRFNDKDRHQLFLEPESLSYDELYIQGFSSSMPRNIQEKMVASIIGLENAVIKKYAYAIEYDALNPLILYPNLETKKIKGLFTAGQINGTSGYEEAAAQGLMAGINAVLKHKGKQPLILKRNQAYIGVLIDDLVTKGTKEPYRLLTSRAEYRLLLRSDNADLRLTELSYKNGFVEEKVYKVLKEKENQIKILSNYLTDNLITPTTLVNEVLESLKSSPIKGKISLLELLRRPEITIEDISDHFLTLDFSNEVLEQVSINTKYEGYFQKLEKEIQKLLKNEKISLDHIKDYQEIPNLASEAIQKLNEVKPSTLGQASRISGVNPADLSILLVHIKKGQYYDRI